MARTFNCVLRAQALFETTTPLAGGVEVGKAACSGACIASNDRNAPIRGVHRFNQRPSVETVAELVVDYRAGMSSTELRATYSLSKGACCGCWGGPVSRCATGVWMRCSWCTGDAAVQARPDHSRDRCRAGCFEDDGAERAGAVRAADAAGSKTADFLTTLVAPLG